MHCFYHFCPCQELRPSLTENDIKRGSEERELDELRRGYLQEKDFTVIEMWECEWWRLCKTNTNVELHTRENFFHTRSLTEHQLLEVKKGNLFGYVQCEIKKPKKVRANFAIFPPLFRKTLVGKNDIGDWKRKYAKEDGKLSQPGKVLISRFTFQIEVLITPLMLFYLQLGLVVTILHRFVEYIPKKDSNSFLQSAMDARRQSDEKPNSSFVAETMKLLAKGSFGFQIKDRSRQTVTKYLSEKTWSY